MTQNKKKADRYDFSQAAVKKAVVRDTVEHPVVLYPTVASVLSGFWIGLMGFNPWIIAVTAGGVTLALLAWAVNYGLRRDTFANDYVKKLYQKMEEQRRVRKAKLEAALAEVNSDEGTSQFMRLGEKFAAFESMLGKKLNPAELTYGRYLGMAEQVYLGALDNLQQVADTLKSVEVIDANYIKQRLKELEGLGSSSENAKKERSTLQERLTLYEKQHANVHTLLAQNEQAMTKIDVTIAAITDMRTEDGSATLDIETAMNELQRLASRAGDYSI